MKELHDLIACDMAEVETAIEAVAGHNADLAKLLGEYAAEFRYSQLDELMRGKDAA
ncbi:MAG: hypothetical protein KZQ88_11935 [Candidatus Thiodiazotropha sp. (ex Dulcina madagascariensis)]|nr:hypothetical protein [Candidatus Thiodiazotropha sp. (ex Dulcina madagascariensis)]MCU7926974.1 hypothetical protein [Candidatus Thiodiazotropha sp. (ex Dulcina madagascariensis)]